MADILLVDDDLDFIESTKAILESGTSHQVTCAYNGEEALEKIKAAKPNLIILDIMMPKKHGYALCEELKNNPEYSGIPILLLTAVSTELSRTRYTTQMGRMTQADDYIDKPVKPGELLSRVEDLLGVYS
jgi:CheY-like chemotaxis protein